MVRVGILGLTGCSGCQCEILNCEDAIISLLGKVDFSFFPLAKESNSIENLDILFVEGSVSSGLDEELVKKGRESSKLLVAIGSCACFGGVQAQRNDEVSLEEMIREVYGEKGVPIKVFKAKPLREVVKVDYELPGCPLEKKQFIYAVSFLLNGIRPYFPKIPVCHECKLSENDCLLLKGIPCLGPVTQAGCGAPCTERRVGCQGCRGSCDFPNLAEMLSLLEECGLKEKDVANFSKVFGGVDVQRELSKLNRRTVK